MERQSTLISTLQAIVVLVHPARRNQGGPQGPTTAESQLQASSRAAQPVSQAACSSGSGWAARGDRGRCQQPCRPATHPRWRTFQATCNFASLLAPRDRVTGTPRGDQQPGCHPATRMPPSNQCWLTSRGSVDYPPHICHGCW